MSGRRRLRGRVGALARQTHAWDVFVTIAGFALVVGIQQLLVLPFIAATSQVQDFTRVVLFFTISSVVANVVGAEAASASLIVGHRHTRTGARWGLHVPFAALVAVLTVSWLIVARHTGVSVTEVWLYLTITVLTSVRYFMSAPFRYKQRFLTVAIAHFAYAVAAASSLFLVSSYGWVLAPFVAGEAFAVGYLVVAFLRDNALPRFGLDNLILLGRSTRTYLALGGIGLAANSVAYLDRLIIYPLLGTVAFAVYYAASVLPKSLIVLVNPAAGLLLAKLAPLSDSQNVLFTPRLVRMVPIVCLVATVTGLVAGAVGMAVLYPQFYPAGRVLLLPISVAVGFATGSLIIQPYILRFGPIGVVLAANLVNASVFIAAALGLSICFGIVGFAWGSALGYFALLSFYLLILKRVNRTGLGASSEGDRA